MLEMKINQVKNDLIDIQSAVNLAYYKAEKWARFAAEVGIANMTKAQQGELATALDEIASSLEPYRN